MNREKLTNVIMKISICLVPVCVIVGFWWSFPVYSDFQRPMDSYEELKEKLEDHPDIVYPNIEDWNAEGMTFMLQLDGRTRNSRIEGYLLYGNVEFQGLLCQRSISCSESDGVIEEKYNYEGIPIETYCVTSSVYVEFCMEQYKYTLHLMEMADSELNSEEQEQFCESSMNLLLNEAKTLIN